MSDAGKPRFWRDSRLPYVELRSVGAGRKICYAPHSHTQWCLGAITEGKSTFFYRGDEFQVSEGTLVLMNPNWVHACNPIGNQPWSYLMLYIDTQWLTRLRYEAGLLDTPSWQDISTPLITDSKWYWGYRQLANCLLDPDQKLLDKQRLLVVYLTDLMRELADQLVESPPKVPAVLQELASYLQEQATAEVSLETLCKRSGYSAGHLIRAFKQYFGFTPHAYQINCRIQLGQQELKSGKPIAETAVNTGFSDQPHFQRTFKRLLAATPKQYRQPLLNQQIDTASRK